MSFSWVLYGYQNDPISFVVLKSEVHDLRLVLQSSDRELAAVKKELCEGQSEQQKETSHLSSSLISTQLQLQEVQYVCMATAVLLFRVCRMRFPPFDGNPANSMSP